MGELTFIKPVDDEMGDEFGDRSGTHYGIDFLCDQGTSVNASERGVV